MYRDLHRSCYVPSFHNLKIGVFLQNDHTISLTIMPKNIALFDKHTKAEWPLGTTPKFTKNARTNVVKKKQKTWHKLPTSGHLYLAEIKTPDGRLFYKIGVTTSDRTFRFDRVGLEHQMIIQVPALVLGRAYKLKQEILRQYCEYAGLFPKELAFKGDKDCLILPGEMVDQVVAQIKSYT